MITSLLGEDLKETATFFNQQTSNIPTNKQPSLRVSKQASVSKVVTNIKQAK
jgi:hypothetical protein